MHISIQEKCILTGSIIAIVKFNSYYILYLSETYNYYLFKKIKFSHLLPSIGHMGLELIPVYSPQVTLSHPTSSRLPLLSARPAVTFPAEECHHPPAGTKLYCLMTKAHACEQFAQGCHLEADWLRFKPVIFCIASECSSTIIHKLKNVLLLLHCIKTTWNYIYTVPQKEYTTQPT